MKHALVTGCSTGIGRAAALRLAEYGFHVHATARRPADLRGLAGAHGKGRIDVHALDVTREDSIDRALRAVEKTAGAIEVLVNNAGYAQTGALEEVPLDLVRRQFETNVFGALALIQRVLPGMRARGQGRIINLSSVAGRFSAPFFGPYSASKFALEALSDALRVEVRPFGIQVVLIEPGPVETQFNATVLREARGLLEDVRSPYRRAYDRFLRFTRRAGPLSASADRVGRLIVRAATARSPRARYAVTVPARVVPFFQRFVPEAAFDLALGLGLGHVRRPKPAP